MTWTLATGLVILAVPVLIASYDIIAYATRPDSSRTISRFMLGVAGKYPAFGLIIAALFGGAVVHLFLPQHIVVPVIVPILFPVGGN